MNILAIESSCDETACAIVKDGTEILGSAVASSTAMHEKWGGIVPEVAAREQLASLIPVLTEALQQIQETKKLRDKEIKSSIEKNIDAIAVTVGPGLIGSLLIGVEAAKTIAMVTGKPIIPVNHVLAHMYANFLESSQENLSRAKSRDNTIQFPAISLVVSGGHTELFLMQSERKLQWLGGTIDDAAGEAFDKTARLLGFGHGGGLAIQEAAKKFIVHSSSLIVKLPRPLMYDKSLNFSFSGLKTAVMREANTIKNNNQWNDEIIAQFAFELQESITDVLVAKTLKAAQLYNTKSILISGGVASNIHLRKKFLSSSQSPNLPIQFSCPPIELCTDNATFIGSYAFFRGVQTDWHNITAIPDLSVES